MMVRREIIHSEFLRLVSFVLIMGLSAGYSLWIGWFPKLSLQFPFIDFPVFIGELVLGLTLAFYLLDRFLNDRKFSRTDALWVVYLLFVSVKAFSGYAEYGPLAFRNAALFYYPLFTVIMGWAVDRKYFNSYIVIGMLIFVLFYLYFYPVLYFAAPVFLLGFILARVYPHKYLRWGFYVMLLLSTSFKLFFFTTRTVFVSNVVCFLALSALLFSALRISKMQKFLCFTFALVGLSVMILTQADLNNLRSMINLDRLWERYVTQKKDADTLTNEVILREVNTKNPVLFNLRGKRGNREIYFSNKEEPLDLSGLPEREYIPEQHLTQNGTALDALLGKSAGPKAQESAEASKKKVAFFEGASKAGNEKGVQSLTEFTPKEEAHEPRRDVMSANTNTLFRVYIWEDMIAEVIEKNAWFGRPFGYPFLSKKLLYLGWGFSEWMRDGWVAAHNSYVEYFYRSGIAGIFLICAMFVLFGRMVWNFVRRRNTNFLILSAILVYWMMAACFSLVFEVPYFAIPFWALWGIAYRYYQEDSA